LAFGNHQEHDGIVIRATPVAAMYGRVSTSEESRDPFFPSCVGKGSKWIPGSSPMKLGRRRNDDIVGKGDAGCAGSIRRAV
jgi:hypothetical protein